MPSGLWRKNISTHIYMSKIGVPVQWTIVQGQLLLVLGQHRAYRICWQTMHPHDINEISIHVSYINDRPRVHVSKGNIHDRIPVRANFYPKYQMTENIHVYLQLKQFCLSHASTEIRMAYNDVITIRHAIEKLDQLHTHAKLPYIWMPLVRWFSHKIYFIK